MTKQLRELTELFRKLGAANPEDWARSQVEEGIEQLPRFLFLREAWRMVVAEGDGTWINAAIEAARKRPGDPFSGVGNALEKLRARGASDEDLTDLVRGMQAELLHGICYLLDDSGTLEPEVSEISWALKQVDPDGSVVGDIAGLHESVLETDPTGREMRPRP